MPRHVLVGGDEADGVAVDGPVGDGAVAGSGIKAATGALVHVGVIEADGLRAAEEEMGRRAARRETGLDTMAMANACQMSKGVYGERASGEVERDLERVDRQS